MSNNPETRKDFWDFFIIYAQNRLFWVYFITDLN
jgi:hypothetical protein